VFHNNILFILLKADCNGRAGEVEAIAARQGENDN